MCALQSCLALPCFVFIRFALLRVAQLCSALICFGRAEKKKGGMYPPIRCTRSQGWSRPVLNLSHCNNDGALKPGSLCLELRVQVLRCLQRFLCGCKTTRVMYFQVFTSWTSCTYFELFTSWTSCTWSCSHLGRYSPRKYWFACLCLYYLHHKYWSWLRERRRVADIIFFG